MEDKDWTKECNASNVNIPKFVDMMQQVKAGKEIEKNVGADTLKNIKIMP